AGGTSNPGWARCGRPRTLGRARRRTSSRSGLLDRAAAPTVHVVVQAPRNAFPEIDRGREAEDVSRPGDVRDRMLALSGPRRFVSDVRPSPDGLANGEREVVDRGAAPAGDVARVSQG